MRKMGREKNLDLVQKTLDLFRKTLDLFSKYIRLFLNRLFCQEIDLAKQGLDSSEYTPSGTKSLQKG